MKHPPIPANEEERIRALNEYRILDTLPDEDFDEITRLASDICRTPISLVSLVDPKRQWFKSRVGLSDSETDRQFSFCAHAINHPQDIFVVNDSRKDSRFADNPYVVGDPHVVFYAGVPLVTPQGYALGTLCVIDSKPRDLSETQMSALRILSKQVIKLFELRKKNLKLTEMQQQLEKRNNDLQQLNYIASHDLREPLRMISGFMDLLNRDYGPQLDDQARQYIQFATDGANRMNSLIINLLNYSAIGQGQRALEVLELPQLLADVRMNLHRQMEERQATFSWSSDLPSIHGNRTEITSLFQNLVSNAIKFGRTSEPPVVTIRHQETADHWQFSVADNGIGVAPSDHQKIFAIFKRVHKDRYPGTGIGLAICEKIVSQHGGNIWIESEFGKGSVFHFTIRKHP
ncbi:MAG: sensor histidine kinase [Bacteroidota bacterium]